MKKGGGQKASKNKKKQPIRTESQSGESKITMLSSSPRGSSSSPASDRSSFEIPRFSPGFDFESYSRSSSPPILIPNTPAMGLRRAGIEARENQRKRERRKRERKRKKAATKLQSFARGTTARRKVKTLTDSKSKRVKDMLYPTKRLIEPGTYAAEENLHGYKMGDYGHTNSKKGPAMSMLRTWSIGGKRRKTKRRRRKTKLRRRKTKRRIKFSKTKKRKK